MKKTITSVSIILMTLFFSSTALFCEDDPVKSLNAKLERAPDKKKAAILNELSELALNSDLETASQYANQALLLARQFKQDKQEALALDALGKILIYKGKYHNALSHFIASDFIYKRLNDREYLARSYRLQGVVYRNLHGYFMAMKNYEKSLALFIELDNKVEIAKLYNNMGSIYNSQALYQEALEHYQKSLAIFEELGNMFAVAKLLNNIAHIYNEFFSSKKAMKYAQRALDISTEINHKRMLFTSLDTIGFIYKEREEYDKALEYYNRALELQKSLGDKKKLALLLTNLGNIYQNTGKYQKALEYHFESEKTFEEISDGPGKIFVYNNIGQTYLLLKDYKQSEFYFTAGHTLIEDSKNAIDKGAVRDNYRFTSELYAATGNYQEAYYYHVEYQKVIDTIYTENANKMAVAMDNKFFEEQQQKERALRNKNIQLVLFICLLVLIIAIGVLLYIRFRLKVNQHEMRGRINFFMNLAHEIKTPLTLIRSYFFRCAKNLTPSDGVDIIQFNLDTLIGYISNFFTLEKMERGEVIYNHNQNININNICEKITALTESACDEKGISIWYDGPVKDIFVQIDPDAMNTILYNLLQNAVKYTETGGQVEVRLKETNRKIQLTVRDTGIGIAPENLPSIFRPFSRLMEDKSKVEGLGLGMSIVKNIVNQIDAGIEIKSKPGEGTECTILFAKSDKTSGDNRDEYPEPPRVRIRKALEYKKIRHNKEKPTILIVEDEPDILCCIQELFIDAGYNAYTAENGKDALEKLETLPRPNVVVSDYMMHPMNGLVLLDTIRQNSDPSLSSLPFVFLSARSTNSDMINGLDKGAVEYIPKPFDDQKLVAQVSALVEYTKRKEQVIRRESTKITDEIKVLPINQDLCLKYGIPQKKKAILKLKQQGFTYKDIAHKMGITEGAVKAHMNTIKQKTEMYDVNQIIRLFFYDNDKE